MKKRNLSDACHECGDNKKSLAWCFDCCGIPIDCLEEIERIRNKSKGGSVYGTVCKKEDKGV